MGYIGSKTGIDYNFTPKPRYSKKYKRTLYKEDLQTKPKYKINQKGFFELEEPTGIIETQDLQDKQKLLDFLKKKQKINYTTETHTNIIEIEQEIQRLRNEGQEYRIKKGRENIDEIGKKLHKSTSEQEGLKIKSKRTQQKETKEYADELGNKIKLSAQDIENIKTQGTKARQQLNSKMQENIKKQIQLKEIELKEKGITGNDYIKKILDNKKRYEKMKEDNYNRAINKIQTINEKNTRRRKTKNMETTKNSKG